MRSDKFLPPEPAQLPGRRRATVALLVAAAHAALLYLLLQSNAFATFASRPPIVMFTELTAIPISKRVGPTAQPVKAASAPAVAGPPQLPPRPAAPPAGHPQSANIIPAPLEQFTLVEPETAAGGVTSGSTAGGIGGSSAGGEGLGGEAGAGDGMPDMRARWRSGAIVSADYPRAANRAGRGGAVTVHFDVQVDGSVRACRVVVGSGDTDLDAATCRLVEQRFRYAPARNARGDAVPDVAGWRQYWWLETR